MTLTCHVISLHKNTPICSCPSPIFFSILGQLWPAKVKKFAPACFKLLFKNHQMSSSTYIFVLYILFLWYTSVLFFLFRILLVWFFTVILTAVRPYTEQPYSDETMTIYQVPIFCELIRPAHLCILLFFLFFFKLLALSYQWFLETPYFFSDHSLFLFVFP